MLNSKLISKCFSKFGCLGDGITTIVAKMTRLGCRVRQRRAPGHGLPHARRRRDENREAMNDDDKKCAQDATHICRQFARSLRMRCVYRNAESGAEIGIGQV